jgi:hypothetical protein
MWCIVVTLHTNLIFVPEESSALIDPTNDPRESPGVELHCTVVVEVVRVVVVVVVVVVVTLYIINCSEHDVKAG